MRLKSKMKRAITFDLQLACAGDPAKGAGHADYRVTARVDRSVLGGTDAHPQDDVCPRRVTAPGEVDPFPDGRLVDTGCGTRLPDRTSGAPIEIDVVLKAPR